MNIKRIGVYFWIMVSVILTLASGGCKEDNLGGEPDGALAVKSIFPSAVMVGSELNISGTGLDRVTSVILPGNIEVTSYETVNSNLIKLTVPSKVETGRVTVVAGGEKADSRQILRAANPEVTSMVPGDEAEELQEITFKGEDLECIVKAIFPAYEDGEEITVEACEFMRKGTSHLKLRVPEGIRNGMSAIRLVAIDGTELVMREINLIGTPPQPAGTVTANIYHIGSGRCLTRNPSEQYPRVMDFTGAKNQQFMFIPVEGMFLTYYIKNVETGEYISVSNDNAWRMVWVEDLSTVSNPQKAMYKIEKLTGGDGYIQIKNLSSKHLGTDSNNDNSEVYGDKNGTEEPRYQWKLDIIKGEFLEPDPSLLFEGKMDFGGWGVLEVVADQLKELKEGDIIRMHFIPEEGEWAQMDLRDKNDTSFPGFEWLGLNQFAEQGYVDFPIDAGICTRLKSGGLWIRGSHYTLTKAEIVSE